MVASRRTFGLLMAILISSIICSAKLSTSDLIQRSSRVLQTNEKQFGTYTVGTAPELAEKCNDKGISPSEFVMPQADFVKDMNSVTDRYPGPRDAFQAVLSSMSGTTASEKSGDIIGGMVGHLIIPLIFAALSLLTFFFFLFYTICSCCCKKTCCMKPIQPGEPLRKSQKIIVVASLVVALALIICTIIWSVQMGTTSNRMKYFPCAFASFYSDVDNGYVGDGYKFIGVKGIQTLVGEIEISLNKYINEIAVSDMDSVMNRNMNTQGPLLLTNLNTLVSENDPASGSKVNTYTTTEVTENPDSIKAIPTTIGTTLKQELTAITDFGTRIHDCADYVKTLLVDGVQTSIDSFKQVKDQLTSVRDQVRSMYDLFDKNLPIGTINGLMTLSIVIAICFVLVAVILYFVIMFFTLKKDKCHCLKVLPKIFMILKALISVFFFLMVGALGVLCVALSNLCYFMLKGTTDPAFTDKINQPTFQKMFRICVLPTGNGDLSGFLDTSATVGRITEFNKGVQTLFNMDTYSSSLSGATATSPQGTILDALYKDSKAMKRDDFTTSTTFGVTSNIDFLNNLFEPKNLNSFRLVGATAKSGWTDYTGTSASASDDLFDQKFSLPLDKLPGEVTTGPSPKKSGTATDRYSAAGAMATGFTASDITSANSKFTNLWLVRNYMLATATSAAASKYADWVARWSAFYGTSVSSANSVQKYYDDLRQGYQTMQAVRSKSDNMLNFLINFQGDTLKSMNCRIIEKEIRTVEIAMCVRFTSSLMNTTASMYAMSILLFFFSWCICCGIRCAPQKVTNPNEAQVQPQKMDIMDVGQKPVQASPSMATGPNNVQTVKSSPIR